MKASVLLLSTCYDIASYYTHQWAQHLQADLVKMGHKCLLIDSVGLCLEGRGLRDSIRCVDYIVFFGHGENDKWIALPELLSRQAKPLVSAQDVSILQGRKVYAGCCWSVNDLGDAYANKFSNGEYIGYNKPFRFEVLNEGYFRDIVNQSVIAFVKGETAQNVVNNLSQEWANLRDAFHRGFLKNRSNAFLASGMADHNRKYIESKT